MVWGREPDATDGAIGRVGPGQAGREVRRSRRVCFFVEAGGGGGAGFFGSGGGSVLGSRCMIGRWSLPDLEQYSQYIDEPLGIFPIPAPPHRPQAAWSMYPVDLQYLHGCTSLHVDSASGLHDDP